MATKRSRLNTLYGYPSPQLNAFPDPIVQPRNPSTQDQGELGQSWVNNSAGTIFFLAQRSGATNVWVGTTSGGTGVFSSLTVTPGPTSITGTTGINTAGAGVTTIGTGGTGAVNIGNATGNTAVTGSLTATNGLSATAGGITAVGTSNINVTGGASTNIGNATGTLTFVGANNILTGNLSATSYLAAQSLIATDDIGAGTVASTTFTNGDVPYVDGSGAFSLSSVTGAGTATNAGYIKAYLGLTPIYIPYFTVTS